jgi:hypothetical protein
MANLDPDDDQVTGPPEPIADCEDRLRALGVKFRPGSLPVRPQPAGYSCGAPQVVIYEAGPTGVKWNAAPVVTCQLALGLARFETLLSSSTQALLGKRVVRINQGGTYSCRKMARFKLVSEHSYANAIDIRSFDLDDKTSISVKRHFGKLDGEPTTPESKFLRTVANRTFDDAVFSVVLTPYWDALHADHFHFDNAHFRVDGTRR